MATIATMMPIYFPTSCAHSFGIVILAVCDDDETAPSTRLIDDVYVDYDGEDTVCGFFFAAHIIISARSEGWMRSEEIR